MSDTTVTEIIQEIIREDAVADILAAKPARPRVLPVQPAEAEVLQAMDELLGKPEPAKTNGAAAKSEKTWTVWVSSYVLGYATEHGKNSMNFLFQADFAKQVGRFDIVKLDAETWVFKPDPRGLRTLHVRGSRGRVTTLDDAAPFRSVAVPLVEVDGVYMAHVPMSLRLPIETNEAIQKRQATIAMRRKEAEEAAKRAAEFQNRAAAQQARRERERTAELAPATSLDQQQAKEKLVQPERLAQAMREFAAPIEDHPPAMRPLEGEMKAILRRIREIEAAVPYRIGRVRNEDGSTSLVWRAPNIA